MLGKIISKAVNDSKSAGDHNTAETGDHMEHDGDHKQEADVADHSKGALLTENQSG